MWNESHILSLQVIEQTVVDHVWNYTLTNMSFLVAEYIGCYIDNRERAVADTFTIHNLGLPSCAIECANLGFPYVGLQVRHYHSLYYFLWLQVGWRAGVKDVAKSEGYRHI